MKSVSLPELNWTDNKLCCVQLHLKLTLCCVGRILVYLVLHSKHRLKTADGVRVSSSGLTQSLGGIVPGVKPACV